MVESILEGEEGEKSEKGGERIKGGEGVSVRLVVRLVMVALSIVIRRTQIQTQIPLQIRALYKRRKINRTRIQSMIVSGGRQTRELDPVFLIYLILQRTSISRIKFRTASLRTSSTDSSYLMSLLTRWWSRARCTLTRKATLGRLTG